MKVSKFSAIMAILLTMWCLCVLGFGCGNGSGCSTISNKDTGSVSPSPSTSSTNPNPSPSISPTITPSPNPSPPGTRPVSKIGEEIKFGFGSENNTKLAGKIIYVTWDKEMYLVDLATKKGKLINSGIELYQPIVWSPDYLMYSCFNGEVIIASTQNENIIRNHRGFIHGWAQKSNKLIGTSNNILFSMNPNGSGYKILSKDVNIGGLVDLSPDSSLIVYEQGILNQNHSTHVNNNLLRINVFDFKSNIVKTVREITYDAKNTDITNLKWIGNRTIAATLTQRSWNGGHDTLHLIDIEEKMHKKYLEIEHHDCFDNFKYNPKTKKTVMLTMKNQNQSILLMNIQGVNITSIDTIADGVSDTEEGWYDPIWSPTGKEIAYIGTKWDKGIFHSEISQIHFVNVDTKEHLGQLIPTSTPKKIFWIP